MTTIKPNFQFSNAPYLCEVLITVFVAKKFSRENKKAPQQVQDYCGVSLVSLPLGDTRSISLILIDLFVKFYKLKL